MQCRVDKRLIELLNEAGASVTWDQFRTAYDRRRAERQPNKPVGDDCAATEALVTSMSKGKAR